MKSLLTIICIGISIFSTAQTDLNIIWQKDFATNIGPSRMEFIRVKALANGSFVGGMRSSEDNLLMYAAFYSTSGTLVWDLTIPSADIAWVNFVDVDANGNFYIGGIESKNGNYRTSQTHIAKIDANGNLLWHKIISEGLTTTEAYNMKLVGNYLYLCGDLDSTNYNIAWLAKFDLSGDEVWKKTFDSGGEVYFDNLTVDNSGNITLSGAADYGYRYLAVQYNASGNINWQYPSTLTGNFEQYFTSISQDDAGNIYLLGTEEGSSSFDFEITTTKLNSSGSLIWSKSYTTGDGYSTEIRLGPNGNLHVFASTEDNFDDSIAVLKYDTSGTLLWLTKYSINASSYGNGGLIDASGNIYMNAMESDSVGFVKLDASGAILAKTTYSTDEIYDFYDYSIQGNSLLVAGKINNPKDAKLIALQTGNLSENFNITESGSRQHLMVPSAITSDTNSVWFTSIADDGDSCNYYITKLDNAGNQVWQSKDRYRCINSEFKHLEHDANGNIIAVFFNKEITTVYKTALVKYDAQGNKLFSIDIDSTGTFEVEALAIGANGEIFICGANTVEREMFVSKYTSNGAHVWSETYQSPNTSFPVAVPLGIKISPQGKLAIIAIHRGTNNVNNLHIFQYSDAGSLEWHYDVDDISGNLTSLDGFEIESNGDITVLGVSGIGFYVLAKYDSGGNELWRDKGVLPSGTTSQSMAIDESGNVYSAFSSPDNFKIKKHDASGNFLKEKIYSLSSAGSFAYPHGLVFTNNQLVAMGNYDVQTYSGKLFEMLIDKELDSITVLKHELEVGYFAGYSHNGKGRIYELLRIPTYQGASLFYTSVKKVGLGVGNEPVAIANTDLSKNKLSLYPNPADDQLYLSTQESGEFKIYNLQGQLLLKELISSADNSIDIQNIIPGIYIWQMNNNQGKLIVR